MEESNIDDLYNEAIDTGPSEVPMTSEPVAEVAPEQHSINVDGKEVQGTLDQLKQWAQMGHGAPNKIGELNKQLEEFKSTHGQSQNYINKYGEIDQYAQQNPDWWSHVEQSYQNKGQQIPQEGNEDNKVLSQLQQEIHGLKEFKTQLTNEKETQKRQQEDETLVGDIKSIREAYSDLDFDAPNEEGKSLETRVLEHANANGISNFKSAFRDLLHEDLVAKAELRGKEAVLKDQIKTTKMGLLGKTKAPVKGLQPVQNVGAKSYDDLVNEALQELG